MSKKGKLILAREEHLEIVATQYAAIHEDLAKTINYPRWPLGIYPTSEDASDAILKKELYVFEVDGCIVGSVILNQFQDEGYHQASWLVHATKDQVMVIHTLAISPEYKGQGYGGQIIENIKALAIHNNCLALRLDITQNNLPARYLYQKHGFIFVGIADLHRQDAGIDYCEMYEYNLTQSYDQLHYIEKVIDDFVTERDWHQYHNADNLAKSIVIEASELLECFQWDCDYDLEHVCEELADVFIYCFQLSAYLKLNVKDIIVSKMQKNKQKYPI